MQAREENNELVTLTIDGRSVNVTREEAWWYAANQAANIAEAMSAAGYHKQIVNRLLEPFQWMRIIVSATEWDNFYDLRDHPDADPSMIKLAQTMRKAWNESTPKFLFPGQWHLPYVLPHERRIYGLDTLQMISTARCARVSYLTHDGKEPVIEKDIKLHNDLVNSTPIHASPTEHAAQSVDDSEFHKNFRGFVQYREEVEQRIHNGEIINKK
jgi:hypothetical protein